MKILDAKQNFLGLEPQWSSYEKSKIVIQSIPYEYTSSYIKGSKNGPDAILNASHFVEFYDEEVDKEIFRHTHGICTLTPLDFKNRKDTVAMDYIEKETEKLLADKKFVASFGAEHTVTLGLYLAHAKRFKNLSLLQIDAHSDLRESYEGNIYSHACVMARCFHHGAAITQVGIRAQCIDERELIQQSRNPPAGRAGIHTFYMHDIRTKKNWMNDAMKTLKENVYLTIDADGFDPSVIPAVGTPEPNGLFWNETTEFLKRVAREKNIVGFDVVELCPKKSEIISEYALAKLIYRLIGYIFIK